MAVKNIFKQITTYSLINFIYMLVIGIIGGTIFTFLSMPLPWILGPMAFTMLSSFTYRKVYLPPQFRHFGFYILGISLGLYFTPTIGKYILDNAVIFVTFSVLTMVVGLMNGFLYKKIFNMDWVTAIFSNIPGGLSQMVEVGHELKGNVDIIAIKQTMRVLLVVIIIPSLLIFTSTTSETEIVSAGTDVFSLSKFILLLLYGLSGALLFRFLRSPLPFLTGPLIIIALLSLFDVSLVSMPLPIFYLGQLFIGVGVGVRFKKEELLRYRKYVLIGFLAASTLTILSFIMAYILSIWAKLDLPTAILSLAPGGIAEMSVTASIVGANVPIVTAFQLLRMVLAVILLPVVIKFIVRKRKT